MNRVIFCVLTAACAALPAYAQVPAMQQPQGQDLRRFPADARRGDFTVTAPPQVLLDGQPAQLSPGSRIFSEHNHLVMSAGIVGRRYLVNYTRDLYGNVKDVWILTPQEAQLKAPASGPAARVVSPDGATVLQ